MRKSIGEGGELERLGGTHLLRKLLGDHGVVRDEERVRARCREMREGRVCDGHAVVRACSAAESAVSAVLHSS